MAMTSSSYSWQYKTLSAGASALASSASVSEPSPSTGYGGHLSVAQSFGFDVGTDTRKSRTIYVGNLDTSITEDFLRAYFGEFGEDVNLPYVFIEFQHPSAAAEVIDKLQNPRIIDKPVTIKVLGRTFEKERVDSALHFHVFIGDLSHDVDVKMLREAFAPYGSISDAKVIVDPVSSRSKGYGFVSYPTKQEAERAITAMNGVWLGHRNIRTNWANRRIDPSESHYKRSELDYSEVFNSTGPENSAVYVGNLDASVTETDLHRHFSLFGKIVEIRLLRSKNCAFVQYDSKDAACAAIVEMNNAEVNNRCIRCSWGKYSKGSERQAEQGSNKPSDHSTSRPTEQRIYKSLEHGRRSTGPNAIRSLDPESGEMFL